MTMERADRPPELAQREATAEAEATAIQGEVVDPGDVAALRNRVSADRAELSRTVTELAGRFDVRARLRQRATSARDRTRMRLSRVDSRVRRPVLEGLERALRWVADGVRGIGVRLRRSDRPRELPPGRSGRG
jgi:hypothetical protein